MGGAGVMPCAIRLGPREWRIRGVINSLGKQRHVDIPPVRYHSGLSACIEGAAP